ncbi:zinc finger and SCAN domain-containing protein 12-like [Chrysoperla carnea]|uniref:zinc finger and SCAN domain-containing protein 12-like n=1 Tax=Chrysoperla carnea TaxID=189513 RepID=UPI001D096753|nr:zinc finger and SCAN domain-containing protein 12-like [Chrysoperla carnea]
MLDLCMSIEEDMDKKYIPCYTKYCFVPECSNTSMKHPEKLFISVPRAKIREKWFKVAKRNEKYISIKSTLYCCEDHFDLPNDMENYMVYKIMGSVQKVSMKKGCLPSKFDCQKSRVNRNSAVPKIRTAYLKRQRLSILKEIEDGLAVKTEHIDLPSDNLDKNTSEQKLITVDNLKIIIENKDISFEEDQTLIPEKHIKIEQQFEDEIIENEENETKGFEEIFIEGGSLKNEEQFIHGEDIKTELNSELIIKEESTDEILEESSYSCDLSEYDLIEHTQIDNGEKSFSCDFCNETFTQKFKFVYHQRLHTREKPFSCDVCDKSFTQKIGILKRPHACNICNKKFVHKNQLIMHKRMHIGKNSYSCAICNKTITQRNSAINDLILEKYSFL